MRLKKTSASVSESSIRAAAAICPAFLSGLLNAEQAYNNIKTGNIRHFFIIFINLSAAAGNFCGIFFHILYFSPKRGIIQGNDCVLIRKISADIKSDFILDEILNLTKMLKQGWNDEKRFYLTCSFLIANCSLETQKKHFLLRFPNFSFRRAEMPFFFGSCQLFWGISAGGFLYFAGKAVLNIIPGKGFGYFGGYFLCFCLAEVFFYSA